MTHIPPLRADVLKRLEALKHHPAVDAALRDLEAHAPQAMELQKALCEIPAPTFHEEVRAAEIVRLMKSFGLEDVSIDAVGNVIGRFPGRGTGPRPLLAVGAHMDTVFPEGTDVTVRREGNRYYGPGIGDNCAGLRAMLETLRAMTAHGLATEADILFVGTVGEEGNGDIRGSKHLFSSDPAPDGFIAVDNTDTGRILHTAIGSHRWRCTVTGPGGHSFGAFGEVPSAIHAVCLAGVRIAHLKVPKEPKSSFTIGTIRGGTSVNTIAPSCSVDIDIRSYENPPILETERAIRTAFEEAIAEEHAIWGITDPAKMLRVEFEQIGNRPAGRRPDDCPVLQAARAAQSVLGIELTNYGASSTDANMPVSLGIPATCLSAGGVQKRTHTVDEYYDDINPHLGPQLILLTVLALAGSVDAGLKPLLPKREG